MLYSLLKNLNVVITDLYIHEDDVKISVLDNSANNALSCIDELTIQYTIEHNGNEFLIAFQSEERNNGMKAYSGYDLNFGIIYGYDADESQEFEEYMLELEHGENEHERIISLLLKDAKSKAKDLLNERC